jgi:hypothetical protein
VIRIACQTGQPSVTEKIAIIMPAKPIIEPTDRSNSPAIIKQAGADGDDHELGRDDRPVETPCAANMPLSPANSRKR